MLGIAGLISGCAAGGPVEEGVLVEGALEDDAEADEPEEEEDARPALAAA
jgi:hypothetical protein